MTCPRCQQDAPLDAARCPKCGTKLDVVCPRYGVATAPTTASVASAAPACTVPGEPAATRLADAHTYTPKHFPGRILTSQSALEGERRTVELEQLRARRRTSAGSWGRSERLPASAIRGVLACR